MIGDFENSYDRYVSKYGVGEKFIRRITGTNSDTRKKWMWNRQQKSQLRVEEIRYSRSAR